MLSFPQKLKEERRGPVGKQAKKKVGGGGRNDSRPNGKAEKQHAGSRGSKGGKMDPGMLVLMGKGIYQQVANRADREKLKAKAASNKKK